MPADGVKALERSETSLGGPGAVLFPAPRRRHLLRAGEHRIVLGERTLVQGILNCTPDSFHDGGRYVGEDAILRRLDQMEAEGADWIDIGGESTRPGADPVSEEEEWRRIAPALEQARRRSSLPVSVDTTKPGIARRALETGAVILNDISGLRFAPQMADLAAGHGAAVILMHMKGEPRTMQADPRYEDLLGEIVDFLAAAAGEAINRGVHPDQILFDPGIGFGKTAQHNCELIRRAHELAGRGFPVLIGASRKSFIGKILNLDSRDRMEGSLAAHVAAVLGGAHVVRTHDIAATVRAVRMADAIRADACG